jgi:long-chain fatty acid transport protein
VVQVLSQQYWVWTEWSTYDALSVAFNSMPGAPNVPGRMTAYKNWEDVFSYRLGAEYAINENWCARFGYVFDDSPVPTDTRGPEMPGSDRHMFMVGLGYQTETWGVDAGYSYLMAKKADVNPADVVLLGNGEYEVDAHILALSYSYRF